VISANLTSLSKATLAAVSNKAVIAIDQDPAGVQGWLVSASVAGNGEVWARRLVDGSYAVALLNRGSTALAVSTTAGATGMPAAAAYTVKNVWTKRVSTTTGALGATVPSYSTVLLRVSAR
jgi:alpha-galactosidase